MTTPQYTPYKDALTNVMTSLGSKPNTVFIGQQIKYAGNPMSTTLTGVSKNLMYELPVMEESQMGISLGIAMTGKTVVSFYPRWDFLLCAANQLVNHVDKIQLMSNNNWTPNLLIRLGKGSDKPLDPGHQHKGDYLEPFIKMCPNISFHNLLTSEQITESYTVAQSGGIHVLVEYPELYYQ